MYPQKPPPDPMRLPPNSRERGLVVTAIALALLFMAHAVRQSPPAAFADHHTGSAWFYVAVIFAPWVVLAVIGKALNNVLRPRR